jgi:hypothetical protein
MTHTYADITDWRNAAEMIRTAGYVHPAEVIEEQAAEIARLRTSAQAPGWRPIDDTARNGEPVIVSALVNGKPLVGEAWYSAERDEWWWANTYWGDYCGDAIIPAPNAYQPLPLPAPPAEGQSK